MSSGGDGGLPILSWDTEMASPLAMLLNTATMEFFFRQLFSVSSGEAGRGARLWLVSFFYADKSAP